MAHHVYIDHRADDHTPFYVGKGNDRRIKDFKDRNVVWHRIVARHGVERKIVMTSDDHDAILQEEIKLIAELKTRAEFGGANLTDGGEGSLGWNPTAETRQHMRAKKVGKKLSQEHIEHMLKQRATYYASSQGEETRKKISERVRRQAKDSFYHERIVERTRGENNGRSVLTEQDVRDIRLIWLTYDASKRGSTKEFCQKYADKFNVTPESIYGIIKNKSWKHVLSQC